MGCMEWARKGRKPCTGPVPFLGCPAGLAGPRPALTITHDTHFLLRGALGGGGVGAAAQAGLATLALDVAHEDGADAAALLAVLELALSQDHTARQVEGAAGHSRLPFAKGAGRVAHGAPTAAQQLHLQPAALRTLWPFVCVVIQACGDNGSICRA